jgi:uncharacterized protein
MVNEAATVAPAAPASKRIEALDFVRGAALFGILLMNITGFGLSHAYSNPQTSGGADGANLWAWIVTTVGFEGTQRALFSILFGAGVVLFTARLEAAGRPDAADIYFRRNLWLIGFGLLNAFIFLWYGDILFTYGVVGLFVYAFRKMLAKHLLLIGVATLLAGAVWNVNDTVGLLRAHDRAAAAQAVKAAGRPLTEEQTGAISAWDEKKAEFKAPPAKVKKEVEARTGGYFRAMAFIANYNVYWQSWGLYRYFSDIFGMMLIGMALYKMGVLTLERPTRFYVTMIVAGYGAGLAVNIAETRWIVGHDFSALAFSQANISYDLGRLAMTMGHLGALLLFVRSGVLPWFRHALAAVGRMAFTNYLTHSVVCAILFTGFGLFNTLERHQLYYIVFAIWAVQLVLSPLWLRTYRFGPMEWLWRYLTYGTRPAFRRTPTAPPAVPPALAPAE